MTPYDAINTAIGLLALWIFWYCFWKDYVVDKFRQDVFSLRNELFLATASGVAPFGFESPEYQKMVQVLNVSIRHMENMTILRFVTMYVIKEILAPGKPFDALDQENQPITAQTTPESREYLKGIQCIHGKYTLRYLATVSPTFIIFIATVILAAAICAIPVLLNRSFSKGCCAVRDRLKASWRRMCIELGELNELSAGRQGGILA